MDNTPSKFNVMLTQPMAFMMFRAWIRYDDPSQKDSFVYLLAPSQVEAWWAMRQVHDRDPESGSKVIDLAPWQADRIEGSDAYAIACHAVPQVEVTQPTEDPEYRAKRDRVLAQARAVVDSLSCNGQNPGTQSHVVVDSLPADGLMKALEDLDEGTNHFTRDEVTSKSTLTWEI